MDNKKRKLCKFSEVIASKFPCVVEGRNESEAKCKVCDCYFSFGSRGIKDVERHMESEKHKKMSKAVSSNSKMNAFFKPTLNIVSERKAAAEATLAYHTVKHHQSYKSMDCTGGLLRKLFSDSQVGKTITCARTKTEAIVNNVISPHVMEGLVETLKSDSVLYFGVSTDASNHGAQKMFPIVIQYFDYRDGGIKTKILELDVLPNETAETITQYIVNTLRKHGIEQKLVSFTADNANVNFGGINRPTGGQNVFVLLKQELQKQIVGVGCPAHILHNCIRHGTDKLEIDIESTVMKIYNYFSVYTVRTEKLKSFCEAVEIQYQQLLSHSKTRWLSLFPAIERILKLFPALKEYFLSVEGTPTVIKRFFEDPFSEIYLWHIHSLMPLFQSKIQAIEKEDVTIVEINCILNATLNTIKSRKDEHFKSLTVIRQLNTLENNGISTDNFKTEIVGLYVDLTSYLEKWMKNIEDFSSFRWMIFQKEMKSFSSSDIASSIEFLSKLNISVDDVKLFDEYEVLKEYCRSSDNIFFSESLTTQWCNFLKSREVHGDITEFVKICQFVFSILAHNANVERMFSLVNAQWSKERNRLTIESVKAILITQENYKTVSCEDFYVYVLEKKELLKKIMSSDKYQ